MRTLNALIDEKQSAIARLEELLKTSNVKCEELQGKLEEKATMNAKLTVQLEEKQKEFGF